MRKNPPPPEPGPWREGSSGVALGPGRSLKWTGDTGRGHPNSPIQAKLQVALVWGNPGIALTTAPRPAMRQGPRPCLCLWVTTGSRIPHSPLGTTSRVPLLLSCLMPPQQPMYSLGVLPRVKQGGRNGSKMGSEEHGRPGAPTASPPHGPQPSPVSQALPVGLGLCQLHQPPALLSPAPGYGDAGSRLRDGQLATKEFHVRV